MNHMLEVCNLNKSYDTFSLKDVTFTVPAGSITGFIGPNGAGKTTTIKTILNMTDYQSGEIRLLGMNQKDENARINEWIGVVMDAPFFVDAWTVTDVESAISPFYRTWDCSRYSDLLKQFHIDKKKIIKDLSRGMKVKLMIAAALSHDAKLLILDEPTSGLDPAARDDLCGLLSDFVIDGNKSVLFSTHITTDLEKIADYITFIWDGSIVFTGPKEELLKKYVLVKGGSDQISNEQKKDLIGYREHRIDFEGMVELNNIKKLPRDLHVEQPSLEDIIIHMNRG